MSPTSGRADGRAPLEIRETGIQSGFLRRTPGSVLLRQGGTRVLCAAGFEERAPDWLKGKGRGWLTAEYGMLPRSSDERIRRDRRGVAGRTAEIQRLIGRSLRAALHLEGLGERTIQLDCDVIEADGGTRTAAITGGFVSLALLLEDARRRRLLSGPVLRRQIAAVSVGIVRGELLLDLDHAEDAAAEVDLNVVQTASGDLIEVQGNAEGKPFSRSLLNEMLDAAATGIEILARKQREVLAGIPLPVE